MLYAIWTTPTSVSQMDLQVRYHYGYNNSQYYSINVTALNLGDGKASFLLANLQDVYDKIKDESTAYDVYHFSGWEIDDKSYGLNETCTVKYNRDSDGINYVDVYPDDDESTTTAQFFVLKREFSTGSSESAERYFSVGSGTLKNGGPGTQIGSDTNTGYDVSEYIENAPTPSQIADILCISLSEAESIRWYVIKNQGDGYHVDGVLYNVDVNWNVEFRGAEGGNKTIVVTDGGGLSKEEFPKAEGDPLLFNGWYKVVDGRVTDEKVEELNLISENITLQAVYYDSYSVTGSIEMSDGSEVVDGAEIVDGNQTVKEGTDSKEMKFTIPEGYTIEDVKENNKPYTGWENYLEYNEDGSISYTHPSYKNVKEIKNVVVILKEIPEVTDKDIILTPKDVSKTYDGTPLAAGVAEAKVTTGEKAKIEYSLDQEEWTTDPSEITLTNYTEGGVKVYVRASADNYSGYVTKEQNITINKRNVTVTGESVTEAIPYDGEIHKYTNMTVQTETGEEGLLEGHSLSGLDYVLEGKNAKTYTGQFNGKAVIMNGEENVTNNYNVITTPGTMKISEAGATDKDIILTPKDVSKTYDGTPLAAGVAEAKVTTGEKAKIEYSLDQEEWTTDPSEITLTNYTEGGVKVYVRASADNYSGYVTKEQNITINKRNVTVTSGSASKTYDGTALTNAEVNITSGSLVDDADVTYVATGTITDVGSTDNTVDVKYASEQMKANYDVTVQTGTLTVTPQTINPGEDPDNPDPAYNGVTVDTPSDAEYDGTAHQWVPAVTDKDGNALVEGTDYEVSYSTDDFTNVTGMITVTITGKGNYTGEVIRTYQITPRAITLTSGSATKTYDGTALTNAEVNITSGSLVDDADVTYVATGTITNVGSSLNRISVSYASEQMAKNYVVTLVEGTLTVNTAPVTPTPTPDGGGTTTPTTPTTPGARTTDDGATTDEPEVEEVEDEETPLSDGEVEQVEDNATPKSNNSIWALINLIAAIVTVILGLFLLLSKRHRNDEEEDEEERQARIERDEEKEQEQKRGWICKVLGVIVAIASVVFFILTEDMSLPMALTDKWTIWMIVIAIVELVLVLVGRHWKDVDDEDQEQQA